MQLARGPSGPQHNDDGDKEQPSRAQELERDQQSQRKEWKQPSTASKMRDQRSQQESGSSLPQPTRCSECRAAVMQEEEQFR